MIPGCLADHPGLPCSRTAPGGYCLPPRCYCGACPWWADRDQVPTYTPGATWFDRMAVESGKRASGRARRRARGKS